MSFKWFFIICCLLISLPPAAADEKNETHQLDIQPYKCVALHKGRTCFADVTISWQAHEVGDYCLFKENLDLPLACWQNRSSGQITYDFESAVSETLYLQKRQSKQIISTGSIVVSWLHANASRKRRWLALRSAK